MSFEMVVKLFVYSLIWLVCQIVAILLWGTIFEHVIAWLGYDTSWIDQPRFVLVGLVLAGTFNDLTHFFGDLADRINKRTCL